MLRLPRRSIGRTSSVHRECGSPGSAQSAIGGDSMMPTPILKRVSWLFGVLIYAWFRLPPGGWRRRWLRGAVLLSLTYPQAVHAQLRSVSPPQEVVPASYFGLHIHRAVPSERVRVASVWPDVGFAAWRLWDAYVSWLFLEPARGEWHFELLDKYVALAAERGVTVLLTLGSTPQWASARPEEPADYHVGAAAEPSHLHDWSEYVRQIAARYEGTIREYEIWNEPDLRQYYSGSVDQMLVLAREAYRILKEVNSANIVVSPSAEGSRGGLAWLDQYLAKGGARYADVIGYHFYVKADAPEALVDLVARVRRVMSLRGASGKPLWNTESGWYMANESTAVQPAGRAPVVPLDEAPGYVARALILGWAAGLSRFYWYAWDNRLMGLTEADGQTPKPAALAYKIVRNWLVGARMTSCVEILEGVWLAELERSGAYRGRILWTTTGRTPFSIPASWRASTIRDLRGTSRAVPGSGVVTLTDLPILIER